MLAAGFEQVVPFVFFGGFIVLFVGLIVLAWHLEKKRTEKFAQTAADMGLEFVAKPMGDDYAVCRHLKLFNKGRSRRARNLIRGKTADIDVLIFDYRFTTGGGKNSSTHTQSVFAFHCPGMDLPGFCMTPENFLVRIAEVFGMQDIDFDSHPAFSNNYRLEADSEPHVRALFDEPVLQYFDQATGHCVEGSGEVLVVYRYAQKLKPEQTRTSLEDAFRIFSLFRDAAESLPQRLGGAPSA